MTGLLSQAVINLTATKQALSALQGLPAAGEALRDAALSTISIAAAEANTVQAHIQTFTPSAESGLNAAKKMIAAKQPITEIKQAIDAVNETTVSLKSGIDTSSTNLGAASSAVSGEIAQIGSIITQLATQTGDLQGQLAKKKSDETAAYKKALMESAFGGGGLAAAMFIIQQMKEEINSCEQQIAAIGSQMAMVRQMQMATNALTDDLGTVVQKISSVKNTVDLLAGDILTIETDLSQGSDLSTLDLVVSAALTQVAALNTDAS